jgi:hypothetical protein
MASFEEHLESLRTARREAEDVMAIHCPGLKHVEQVSAAVWDRLFDLFQKRQAKANLDQLNTVAGIIFKLTQSTQQLKGLERKTREFEEKWQELRRKAERIYEAARQVPGLSPDLRAEIERELSLLS